MNIDDLNKSISEMSDDELYETLKTIRSNRRKPEQTTKTKTKSKSKSKSKKDSFAKMLENLSSDERKKLLEELK